MIGAILLMIAAAATTTPRVTATASRTEVSVGEAFAVDVKAEGPPGTFFVFPADTAVEGFELRTSPADSAFDTVDRHRYRATVFAIGDAQVPPITVRYRLPDGASGEATTAAIPLHVVSLLPKADAERKLADVRGPVSSDIGRAFWIGLILVALAISATAWWIVTRLRRRTAPVAAAPATPWLEPDEEARLALDALLASGRLARAEYRPFYIELTRIAKRYLERRLGAPIVEMTTVETIAFLRQTPSAVEFAPTVRDLTGAADQIKFARGSGLTEEAERHLAATRALIETLESRLKPAPPAGQAA
jgi:hypothetical protein